VTGDVWSDDFPASPAAFQRTYGGTGDAFVMKLTPVNVESPITAESFDLVVVGSASGLASVVIIVLVVISLRRWKRRRPPTNDSAKDLDSSPPQGPGS